MSLTTAIPDSRDRDYLLSALAPLLSHHRLRVRVFGSRARGDARRSSDIDVALIGEAPLPLGELAIARQAIEDSNIPFRVDLLDYATAAPALKTSIDREGVEWPV